MPLLPIFSFTFSLFILWNIILDLLRKYSKSPGPGEPEDNLFEDLEPTRLEELLSLFISAIINLGWMGYVKYTVPSLATNVLFDIAPLVFLAELVLIVLPKEQAESTNLISYTLFLLQAYFSVVYLMYCSKVLETFLWQVF